MNNFPPEYTKIGSDTETQLKWERRTLNRTTNLTVWVRKKCVSVTSFEWVLTILCIMKVSLADIVRFFGFYEMVWCTKRCTQAITSCCRMWNIVYTVLLEVHSMTTRCQRCLGRSHDPQQVSLMCPVSGTIWRAHMDTWRMLIGLCSV